MTKRPLLEPDIVIDPQGYEGLVDVGSGWLAREEDLREKAIARPLPPMRALPSTLEAWLDGRSEETRRAYKKDLLCFGRYLNVQTEEEALAAFFSLDGPTANTYVLDYRNKMVAQKLAGATINRRLASLRSLAKVGLLTGKTTWTVLVDNVDVIPYRDTSGPGVESLKKMKTALADTRNAVRNRAILTLLQTNGLRRSELAELVYPDHIDFTNQRISIMGKGRREREWVTTSKQVLEAITKWIKDRGSARGSLFGLEDGGVYKVIRKAATDIGIKTSPHKVRHTAITRVLDENKGDVRMAAAFARHRDLKVTSRYDDNRKNIAADAVALIAADLDD